MSRLISLALRSWPDDYRAEHGEELAATAEELAADRSSTREAISLFFAGFGARYRDATGADSMRTWTAAARIALLVTIATVVAEVTFAWLETPAGRFTRPDVNEAFVSGLLVAGGCGLLMTIMAPRPMAIIGTLAGALSLIWGPDTSTAALVGAIVSHLALLWFLAWRDERPDPRLSLRLAFGAGILLAAALTVGTYWYLIDSLLLWVTLAALVLARWDPRPLAGMCLHWLTRFAMYLPGLAAGELHQTNVSRFYVLAGVILTLSLVRAQRSIRRAAHV
ncbi:MAG: hypothetical protein AAF567_02895 [Actinomycetota bacterium]